MSQFSRDSQSVGHKLIEFMRCFDCDSPQSGDGSVAFRTPLMFRVHGFVVKQPHHCGMFHNDGWISFVSRQK